jgi:hypothetical protein
MKQVVIWAFAIVVCVATCIYQVVMINTLHHEIKCQDEVLAQNNNKIIEVKSSIDSLKAQNEVLCRSIIYLDSCQQIRTSKTDRAERRGKFVGGLLKGIFPSL